MARVPPLGRPATYDDLVELPDNVVGEIIDGELHASPRPAPAHLTAKSRLMGILSPAVDLYRPAPGRWRILHEPELHLARDVLVPDLAGWQQTRMPRLPGTAFFTLAPDWVCEVLSPSTAALDRATKLTVYAREAVPYAWLLDPVARTLEVLQLRSGRWSASTHAGDELVRAAPFADIEISLALFWRDD